MQIKVGVQRYYFCLLLETLNTFLKLCLNWPRSQKFFGKQDIDQKRCPMTSPIQQSKTTLSFSLDFPDKKEAKGKYRERRF